MRRRTIVLGCVILIVAVAVGWGSAGAAGRARVVRPSPALRGAPRAALPFNLVAMAGQAQWLNDRGESLPFPGPESDSRGFARVITTRLVGIPRTYENALETHPRWAANGAIEGRYHLTIPAGAVFDATVGFREGATGTDGVTFEVWWAHAGQAQLLDQMSVGYGRPGHMTTDLGGIAGQEGDLILRVVAGPSSERDWAIWLNPAVEQKRERPAGQATETTDQDQDGIPDAKEREILDKYRPVLLYAKGEDYRPCDAVWYVRHSSLKAVADEGSDSVISGNDLRADPSRVLTANKPGGDWGPSDITRNARRTRYCLNPGNEYRDGYEPGDGYDWPDILRTGHVGVYGHVVPWRNYYEVSYWLFYGYNDSEAWEDIADHEGDWESVHLLIDPATGWLVKTFHCAHGSEMSFDFSVQGISRAMQSTLVGDVVEFRGPNYDVSDFNMRTNTDRACNNLVRFYPDPDTGEQTHIMVYVERNTHGSWPSEHWTYKVNVAGRDYGAPPHPGNANMYLSKGVPNLGEVEHPLSDEARVILRYNGRWGAYRGHAADTAGTDTPPGPQLHWQWVWPKQSHLSGLRKSIPEDSFSDKSSFFHASPY